MPTNFNLYDNSIESAQSLTIYSYQTGAFLSAFSGLFISNTSASTIKDFGIASQYTVDEFSFNLSMNTNSYLASGSDTSFAITISDFYLSNILGSYSGCTIGVMSPENLETLAVYYVA